MNLFQRKITDFIEEKERLLDCESGLEVDDFGPQSDLDSGLGAPNGNKRSTRQ